MATTSGHLPPPIYLLALLILFISSNAASSPRNQANVVVGTVYCDTCFDYKINLITGAVISVECHSTVGDDCVFRKEVKTSIEGEFRFHFDGVGVKACSARLLSSVHPFCSVGEASSNFDSSPRQLKKLAVDGVVHIYSAGFFTFRPINQPNICKRRLWIVPPNPFQPPSLFPPPPLFPPNPFQPPPPILPPNPFQPPPPFFPPNPFQPALPTPILPPYPFLPSPPPPSPLFNFPKIPGLTPPPSPPPSPIFNFPKIPGLAPPSPPPPPPFFHIPKIPGFFTPPLPPPSPEPFFHIPKIPGFFTPPPPPRRDAPPYVDMKSAAP